MHFLPCHHHSLVESDSVHDCLILSHENKNVLVDISCAGSIPLIKNRLYQVIGEMQTRPLDLTTSLTTLLPKTKTPMILKARIIRNIDGLDVNLFDKALKIKREFESANSV